MKKKQQTCLIIFNLISYLGKIISIAVGINNFFAIFYSFNFYFEITFILQCFSNKRKRIHKE